MSFKLLNIRQYRRMILSPGNKQEEVNNSPAYHLESFSRLWCREQVPRQSLADTRWSDVAGNLGKPWKVMSTGQRSGKEANSQKLQILQRVLESIE